MKKQEKMPHCQNSSKIQLKNRREAKLIPLTHITAHFPGLVQALINSGRGTLVLWAQSIKLIYFHGNFIDPLYTIYFYNIRHVNNFGYRHCYYYFSIWRS